MTRPRRLHLFLLLLGLAGVSLAGPEPEAEPVAEPAAPSKDAEPAARTPETGTPLRVGGDLPADVKVVAFSPELGPSERPEPVSLASLANGEPLVVVFWSARCPVCRRYGKRLEAVARDFAKSARIVVVFPNEGETQDQISRAATVAKLGDHLYLDPLQAAARSLDVHVTPTALLFDGEGVLRYRGSLDDDRQGGNPEPGEPLRIAIAAVLKGDPVESAEPRAFGCSVRVGKKR